jgi:hypothetical protein
MSNIKASYNCAASGAVNRAEVPVVFQRSSLVIDVHTAICTSLWHATDAEATCASAKVLVLLVCNSIRTLYRRGWIRFPNMYAEQLLGECWSQF